MAFTARQVPVHAWHGLTTLWARMAAKWATRQNGKDDGG
jgi:hypothetical protein